MLQLIHMSTMLYILFTISSRTTETIPVTDTDYINSHWHNVGPVNWWLRYSDWSPAVEMPETPTAPPPPSPPEQRSIGRPTLAENHIEANPVQRLARIQQ